MGSDSHQTYCLASLLIGLASDRLEACVVLPLSEQDITEHRVLVSPRGIEFHGLAQRHFGVCEASGAIVVNAEVEIEYGIDRIELESLMVERNWSHSIGLEWL
jgi:hypothetical protein